MRFARPVLILLAGAALAPLAACKVDNRPLLARFQGPPPAAQYAALPQPGGPYEAAPQGYYPPPAPPPAYASGAVRRIRYEPARAWPYAEQAYGLDRTFYDVPPDYGFYYADEEPWVWEADDDSLMFAEPYGDAYRFYYYEPDAAYPYFVADPYYGYAFGPDGALIALFDAAGALLAADSYDRYYPTAQQYWTRGLDLRQAYVRAPRYQVTQAVWSQRAPLITRDQQPWIRAGDTQPAWRDWRARTGQDFVRRYAPDRQRHIAMAASLPQNGQRLAIVGARGPGGRHGGGPPMLRAAPPAGRQMRLAEARAPEPMRAEREPRFQGPRERGPMAHGRPQVAFAAPHGRGHMGRAPPQMAFSAERAGRAAVARGPEAHGGGHGPRFAGAPPQVQGPPHPFGGGGGRHGGGPPAQSFAQAQPQAAAPQAHGNPHAGGGPGGAAPGGGHGNGGQGGGQKDRGHGKDHGG